MQRKLNATNIDRAIANYEETIAEIGQGIDGLRGVKLFTHIKRQKTKSGPYSDCTLFEAANRIMSDLVILYGVNFLLSNEMFPFDEYLVEYGNENNNEHDIEASKNGKSLSGEAFNVASSFFQGKKSSMLAKLRNNKPNADFILILANSDSVKDG